jgi:hypothetical protein
VIKAHESDITKLTWLEEDQTLLTSGKDKVIKVFAHLNSLGMENAFRMER